jgi:hypothetical protein
MGVVVHDHIEAVARHAGVGIVVHQEPWPSVRSGWRARVPAVEVADQADEGLVRRAQDEGDGSALHQVAVRAPAQVSRQGFRRDGSSAKNILKTGCHEVGCGQESGGRRKESHEKTQRRQVKQPLRLCVFA